MKTILQISWVILLFFIYCGNLLGQNSDRLTIEKIFSGELQQEYFDNVQWMRNTLGFTKIKETTNGNEIQLFDIKKASGRQLFKLGN
jgi:hypothetical protein